MKTIPVAILALSLTFASAPGVAASPATSFYAVGHEDDWQLFMNPEVYNDVRDSVAKTVIIHTTAGDAGLGIGSGGRQYPYYLAREEGALRAMRFIKSSGGRTGQQRLQRQDRVVNGHTILRYASTDGRAVLYFLRLPDGGGGDTGYPGTGYESIEKLKTAGKPIHAIDGSTAYVSWTDLTSTLAALARAEAAGSSDVSFSIADTDASVNPGDHSDHRFTSYAMQDARRALSGCIDQLFYSEYDTASRPQNITGDALLINAATWGATTSGISDLDHPSTFEAGHNAWLSRDYYRLVRGTGTCQW